MAHVRFARADSEKLSATFTVIADDPALEGLEIGGGNITAPDAKGVVMIRLNPTFARNAGLVPAAIEAVTEDGDTVSVASPKGRKAAETLTKRIGQIWTANEGAFGKFGL